jgi:hypothetical protein
MRSYPLSLGERARVRVRVSAKAEPLTPTLSQWEREKEGRP